MTLIEAIKTEQRFRRPCFPEKRWHEYANDSRVMSMSTGSWYYPCKEDILADDWEVESEKITISKDDYIAASHQVYGSKVPLAAYEVAKILGL